VNGAWRFTLLGYQCGLRQPYYLAMIAGGLLGRALALFFALRRRARLAAAVPDRLLARSLPAPRAAAVDAVGFYMLALMLFGFALAQPSAAAIRSSPSAAHRRRRRARRVEVDVRA